MAWEELLSRYTRRLVRTITDTLVKVNRKDLADKQDIRYDIYIQIVDRILEKGLPRTLASRGLGRWLKRVAHNETITWLRKQGVVKSVIIQLEERHTTSLDMPLDPEADQTLGDMLQADEPEEQEEAGRIREEVSRLLAGIAALDPAKRLILRVYLMFYDTLSDRDVREIAKQRNEPVEKVRAEVAAVQEALIERETQRLRHQNLAGIAWYLVQKLERRLRCLREDPGTDQKAMAGLKEELEHQRKRHEKLVKKAASLVRPTNEEICRLLGMDATDEKIVKGISLKIFRMRQELRAHRG